MPVRLSQTSISSFCGHVLPLRLLSDTDISGADIRWTSDSDCVSIRSFDIGRPYSVRDGVLLILQKIGTAAVRAELDGNTYTCKVTVRERRRASGEEKMQYFIGDLHDHTSTIHRREAFAERTSGFIADYLQFVRDEKLVDFCVISDHGDVTTERDFLRGFTDYEEMQPMHSVVFPGSESEATVIEVDRFGLTHKNSGEIVMINAADYSGAQTWQEFYDAFADSPLPVATFAHPQVLGSDGRGLWNFCLHKNNTPELKRMIRLVEMGNGTDRSEQMLYEYVYSVALDNGFSVSTSCSSDAHSAPWICPGKTVIMAPEKSQEMFLDALLENRAYACESGNIKLYLTVNGKAAPAHLAVTDRYEFHMECDFFREDPTTVPVQCQVISDYGLPLKTFAGDALTSLDFVIESDCARYFYLRLVDSQGRKTWSPPVWTGRAPDRYSAPEIRPIEKSTFLAYDEVSGKSAEILLNENPLDPWGSGCTTASIMIDMQKEYTVSALGHYPAPIPTADVRAKKIKSADILAGFVSRCAISVSTDGRNFRQCYSGIIRTFGGEEVITFAPVNARYVKFEALSTVGRESGWQAHADATVRIGELTVFEAAK